MWSSLALACPSCPTTQLVRNAVLERSFAAHLLQIALPLVVVGMIGALLYRYVQ